MKKTKIISIAVAMLAVVALGVFMGKYMFKLMEATSSPTAGATQQTTSQDTVKVLYSDNSVNSEKAGVPSNTTTNTALDSETLTPTTNIATPQEVASVATATTATNNVASASVTVSTPTQPSNQPNNTLAFSPTGPKWYAYATTNGLNVRETPAVKGKLLFKVSKGTRGVVKEKKDGWSYIQWDFNKKKGWSIDEYLLQGPAGVIDQVATNPSSGSNTKAADGTKKEQLTQANVTKMLEQSKTVIGVAKPAPASETVIIYSNKDLPKRGTITPINGANIREQPTTQSARLIKLPKGTSVGIKSVKKVDKYQWFEITYSNGTKSGWTREDNLQF